MKDEEPPYELRERTKQFGLRIVRMFVTPPKTEEGRVLGKQVLRSGTAVGANYREAHRSRSTAEFIAKLGDCLKELDESSGARSTTRRRCPKAERGGAHQTTDWLELLTESGIVPPAKLATLQDEPSGVRQTARKCCPEGERGGAHQPNQLLAILTTIAKKSKDRNS